jgi:S1-C subfamily serine protease
MKKHRNVLYSIVFILLVLQITSFVTLSTNVSKARAELDFIRKNVTQNLEKEVDNLYSLNQQNLDEILKVLSQQQASFDKQINLLKSQKGDFSGIIEGALESVVSVITDRTAGTGFIVDEGGYIVTNYHVIAQANRVMVTTINKNSLPAKILGVDGFRDLALLKVEGNFEKIELADSDEIQVGEKVIAIGNPLGLSFTVTEGIISAKDRIGPTKLSEYLQTDVSLNPGNSGGPLIDTSGKVVGINNFKVGGAESLGFALESNVIKEVINSFSNTTIIIN